jgi:hypothetical protein
MRSHKAPRNPGSTSSASILLPELLDSTRDTLTIALAQFPGIWVSEAMQPARELFTNLASRSRNFNHLPRFQCGSERPGAGTAHGIPAIPQERSLHRGGGNINE